MPDAQNDLEPRRRSLTPPEAALNPARILLVDDDAAIRDVMGSLLEAFGHVVTQTSSGREALAHLEDAAFDLLVTDFGMPGMNGIELAEEVRRRALELPLILLTGQGTRGPGSERGSPFALVVGKPITADSLRDAVNEVLGPRST